MDFDFKKSCRFYKASLLLKSLTVFLLHSFFINNFKKKNWGEILPEKV